MRLSDNLSGVGYLYACSTNAPTFGTTICFSTTTPTRPSRSATVTAIGYIPSAAPTGTYTITSISMSDIAGNINNNTDATAISDIFGGHPSFMVTQ
jgi:hypothetical protein